MADIRETSRDTDCAGLPDVPYDVWKRMRSALDQRARYPEDWKPPEYFADRVALLIDAVVAGAVVIGIVAFSFWMNAHWL